MNRLRSSFLWLALALPTALAAQQEEAGVAAGDLTITAPFARATLPNQPVAGGYLTIGNAGEADRLLAAASPSAGAVDIHEMAMEGEVMWMRALEDGLVVPAGDTMTLEPGGHHLMFRDLAQPFVEGEAVEVTLSFEQAGDVTVTLPILAPDAPGVAGPVASAHAHHGAADCAAQAPSADCPSGEGEK